MYIVNQSSLQEPWKKVHSHNASTTVTCLLAADAVYEGIAGVLLSRAQGLMNQYQQTLLRDEEVILCCSINVDLNYCYREVLMKV